MTSYLRSWLSLPFTPSEPVPTAPTMIVSQLSENDDDDETETIRGDDEDDAPPAFPSINSAQRLDSESRTSGAPAVPRILSDSDRMPPPPMPSLAARRPGVPGASSSLAVPPGQGSLAPPPSTTKAPAKKSRKVALAPGHGPLDWANLKKSEEDLRVRLILLTCPHLRP